MSDTATMTEHGHETCSLCNGEGSWLATPAGASWAYHPEKQHDDCPACAGRGCWPGCPECTALEDERARKADEQAENDGLKDILADCSHDSPCGDCADCQQDEERERREAEADAADAAIDRYWSCDRD